MHLEEKLRELQRISKPALESRTQSPGWAQERLKPLPAQRVPHGIEEYVEGRVRNGSLGEYFVAEQALPFGRPYGKMRIGDIAAADLRPLETVLRGPALPSPERLLFLDTETTGLLDGTGTCAFLIGIGSIQGSQFVVRQFFLRDYAEESAVLTALAEEMEQFEGLVTFNGKSFDAPLLEGRYRFHCLESPFKRIIHLDLLHPARRLWKLRLGRCHLTHLETHVLDIARDGDVSGSEIPGIYFDYLHTRDPRGLQPVFFHNALDIMSLAALTVEMARVIHDWEVASESGAAAQIHSVDLLSLSHMLERAGAHSLAFPACARAIALGLPKTVEPGAMWQLAAHHKRREDFESAEKIWLELTALETPFVLRAFRELAIYYERRQRDFAKALQFTEQAINLLTTDSSGPQLGPFTRRRERLQKRLAAL
ncbi:MAG TPA: ribonuclease H-like domain-containing protein [Terriglobia bacterium]|nr:ribonuclease H-like domain-containing protein [Terriglobia bacterium]